MAGQHIEREARYEQTGMTGLQRDQLILRLRSRGYSQAKIAHHLGMTQQAISYALMRLAGKSRRYSTTEVCDGCQRSFPKEQINIDGFCAGCAEDW
jgi:DNA-binding NarL/FixJ family response regulator